MSSILKRKKLIILVLFIAVFSIFLLSKNKISFLTAFNRNNKEYNLVLENENRIQIDDNNYVEGVTFDVYFLKDLDNDGEADGIRGSDIEIGKSEKLYFDLNVSGDSKIKDGTISFISKNVRVGGTLAKSSIIPSTLSSTDYQRINLAEVGTGTSSFFYLNVTPYVENNLNNFSAVNKVIFRGTIVDNITGEETPFEKTIDYTVDTHASKISTGITTTTGNNVFGKADITYEITVQENYNAMPLKASYLTGSVADFEGYHPSSVVVSSADGVPVEFNYDSDTQTFTAVKNATVNDNKIITRQAYNYQNNSIRYNKWYVHVVYDVPEDEVLDNKTTSINVTAWYTGFTDIDLTEKKSNEVNRLVSHILTVRPPAVVEAFTDSSKIQLGGYSRTLQNYFVDKSFLEDVYLGQQTGNFTLSETWNLNTYTPEDSPFVYKENGLTMGSTRITDFTTYKTMRLSYYPGNNNTFKITVTNADTNDVVFIIDKDNYQDTFEFPNNVRRINITTHKISAKNKFLATFYFTKEIDSPSFTNAISIDKFSTFSTIRNSGTVYAPDYSSNASNPFNGNAAFSDTYSEAKLKANQTSFAREISSTSIPMTYVIEHNAMDVATKSWDEGFYLLKLPTGIIGIENLEVTPEENVVNSEVIDIEGQKFIKIINKLEGGYNRNINVSFDAIVDPTETDCSGSVELYAINNTNTLYTNPANDIYDVDSDGSTSDKASHSYVYISIKAPNELLTGSIITDYDDAGSETVSPLIADVNPLSGDSDANVNVFLINNSSFKIKNIDLVGKLAYQGNTYEGISGDLGSEYDVQLAGPIQIPLELDGDVIIYYSTVEAPTRDLNDTNNGWVTEVSDYSTIKSYMIKFKDDVEMNVGDKYSFIYPIEMPNTTENLLKKTYFNHGLYFNRITDAGTRPGQVTAPKLGVRMARKYDLNLNVFKAFSNIKAPGGSYLLTDDEGNTQTITISNNGNGIAKGLYVGKEYKLKQYSAPYKYSVDPEEKTFKVINKDDDSLELTYDGTYRRIEYTNSNILDVDLNMEVLFNIDLHNIDADTSADISSTIFKVTGKNYENGTKITTDSTGHAYLYNMEINQIYEVEQFRIDNYSKIDNFNIKLERDPNTHDVKILVESTPPVELYDCNAAYSLDITKYSNANTYYYVKAGNTPSATYANCNLKIDLTKFRGTYSFDFYAYIYDYMDSYNSPYARYYLTKDYPNKTPEMFIELKKSNNASYWRSISTGDIPVTTAYEYTDVDNNQYTSTEIKGGSVYYLYSNYKKSRYSGNSPYMSYTVQNLINENGNEYEFIFQDETEGVNPKDNLNVSQSIRYYAVNDSEAPILDLEVRNKYIEKAYLEITKKDGETGEILTGAQYRIKGPGLPASGKYLTIDENGKATVELYMSYTGDTYRIPGLNSNYPIENYYTIEEIIPPAGYSIEDKPVTFKLAANYTYEYSTQELSREYKLNYNMYENNNKFQSYEIDSDNKTWKVVMVDYPIVKVTKTDEETGELLPNTYYVVYSISRTDGYETLDFAKDTDGNYIGEKLIINGQEYYVVKTDANGSFTLNLSSGSYQLREVQAADDKYEISNEIHYFGVGETVPYQAAGVSLVNGTAVDNTTNNQRNGEVYHTSDGGLLLVVIGADGNNYGPLTVTKYDSDYNQLWTQQFYAGYSMKSYFTYFDDPDRVDEIDDWAYYESNIGYYDYKEYDDGYYFGVTYDVIVKLDKDTGDILLNTAHNSGEYSTHYVGYCEIPDGMTLDDFPTYQKNPLYTDKTYCSTDDSYVYYNNFSYYDYNPHVKLADDGYIYFLSAVNGDGHYGFILSDGTKYIPEPYVTGQWVNDYTGVTYYSHGKEFLLLKFNRDGELLEVKRVDDIIRPQLEEKVLELYPDIKDKLYDYLIEQYSDLASVDRVSTVFEPSFNYQNNFTILPDGDIMFATSDSYIKYEYSRYSYNPETGNNDLLQTSTQNLTLPYVVRMDKDFNVKYVTPLTYNKQIQSLSSNNGYMDQSIRFYDDGSFEYTKGYSISIGKEYEPYTPNDIYEYLADTEYSDFDLKIEDGHSQYGYYSYVIHRYDTNGKPDGIYEIGRNYRSPEEYDTTNDMQRAYINYTYFDIVRLDDGYIVGVPLTSKDYEYSQSEPYRTVELKSGEVVRFNEKSTYVVYKVNSDDTVEWVKQYGNLYSNRYGMHNVTLKDNKFVLYLDSGGSSNAAQNFGATDGDIVTSYNDLEHAKIYGNSDIVLLEFELRDEVTPEAPEATSLNLTNKRKEYKVNVTSNEGGSFNITNPNGDILYTGTTPGTVETVKHGDNSVNSIKVITNPGYGIKEITVNDEPATYTVNSDGTIIIDNFNNVTEDKNINVVFELGNSKVIVHHYLKDTTTKIASDELLSDRIGKHYTTEAKANRLYSLIKDSNGEYILPNNHEGTYGIDPIEVTYYYEVNMVDLRIYFLKNDTQESLAQTIIEQHELGFEYFAEAANIPHYRVVNVVGNEHGTMDSELTEVTYFYGDAATGTVTVRHVGNDTGLDIVEPVVKVIEVGSTYETSVLNPVPAGYVYASRVGNEFGSITTEDQSEIVTYYYDRITSTVTTKHIDATTGDELDIESSGTYNYGSTYSTSPSSNIPSDYVLKETPSNASGTVYDEDIVVTYEYVKNNYKVVTKYIDAETNRSLAPNVTVDYNYGDDYSTNPLEPVPEGYTLDSTPENATGTVTSTLIEVVYKYNRIKSTITVRYVDPETERDITDPEIKVVNLGDRYTTSPLRNVPKGYKLKSTPDNASGIADSENIEVIYYYQRMREVKDITDTYDNILNYMIIGVVSILGIIITTLIVKKIKKA